MHDSARRFCESVVPLLKRRKRVLEIGSRNVNGSIRYLFPRSEYIGIDLVQGPGVDIVADGATCTAEPFDCVISTEALEHAPDPAALCANMVALCTGVIVITAAGPERKPHGIEGADLVAGEHYQAVTPELLREWLCGCRVVMTDETEPEDIYCVAIVK
jgi:hypothetical protein